MNDLNNNKVNYIILIFQIHVQKELQALHKPGSSCVTRFFLGVDFTQIRREKSQGVRKVGGRGKSWIMLGKIEK